MVSAPNVAKFCSLSHIAAFAVLEVKCHDSPKKRRKKVSHCQVQCEAVTMALMPSGKRKRLYSVSTVSLGSTAHCLCSRTGPVSSPSSAQNTLKPAFLSPRIRVLWRVAETKPRGKPLRMEPWVTKQTINIYYIYMHYLLYYTIHIIYDIKAHH